MNKTIGQVVLLGFTLLFVGACHAPVRRTKAEMFPLMYEEKPLTIFVAPPINSTTAADAREYYATAIPQPLAFAGFYVIPVDISAELLRSQGIYDTELIIDQPLERFYEYFGADAVLFTHIKHWDKSYLVIASNLTVEIEATLRSTKTNRTLWGYSGTIVADLSGQSSSGNPIVDLIAKAVITSINTAAADYVPYAQLATTKLLQSVPFGQYHLRSSQDGGDIYVDMGYTPPAPVAHPESVPVAAAPVVEEPATPAITPVQVEDQTRSPITSETGTVPKFESESPRAGVAQGGTTGRTPNRGKSAIMDAVMPRSFGVRVYQMNNEVFVAAVARGSAAEAAGLVAGDRITFCNGTPVGRRLFEVLRQLNEFATHDAGTVELSWVGKNGSNSALISWGQI